MQTGEVFRGGFIPGDGINSPGLRVVGIGGENGRALNDPPMPDNREWRPFRKFRPSLASKLILGSGGNYSSAILERGERPEDQPGDQRGLAYAVTARYGVLDRLIPVELAFLESLAQV